MRTVFFDVDTQMDFLYPAGALSVPGAESVEFAVSRLNRFAAKSGSLVVSTMDAHSENDPEFKEWPAHCVVGTLGQRKPAATLLDKRVVFPNQSGITGVDGVEQVLLEKQTFDCFTNCRLRGLLAELKAERYFVYGVVTEICVRLAALGLIEIGGRVELATDVVKELSTANREKFVAEFVAKGGVLTTIAEVCRE